MGHDRHIYFQQILYLAPIRQIFLIVWFYFQLLNSLSVLKASGIPLCIGMFVEMVEGHYCYCQTQEELPVPSIIAYLLQSIPLCPET